MRITSTNSNVIGFVDVPVKDIPLYIKPSAIDPTSPEMYNYNGEQLYFVEVPYDALFTEVVGNSSEKLRTVLTLAKMEKNIASNGVSHQINPAYGVESSKVESFTFKTKDGKTATAIPQDDQYRFYSNKGMTKILGVLEHFGDMTDFINLSSI